VYAVKYKHTYIITITYVKSCHVDSYIQCIKCFYGQVVMMMYKAENKSTDPGFCSGTVDVFCLFLFYILYCVESICKQHAYLHHMSITFIHIYIYTYAGMSPSLVLVRPPILYSCVYIILITERFTGSLSHFLANGLLSHKKGKCIYMLITNVAIKNKWCICV
jgi:hypothetical protein